MIDKYKYELRHKYPHMKPNDIAIWERFIRSNPAAYDEVQYDLGIGLVPPFDTMVAPDTGGADTELYLRKVDVVGFKGSQIDIIEVKPNASPAAIGQVKHNAFLYKNFVDKNSTPNAVIITDNYNTDVLLFAASQGVKLIQV